MTHKTQDRLKKFWREFSFTDIYSGSKPGDKAWYKKAISWIWKMVLLGLVFFYLVMILLSFDNLPTFEELENPKYNEASLILSHDGTEFGKFWNENRVFMRYDEINPTLIQGLIATEDLRYHSHSGIDFQAVARVIFKTLLFQRESSGGGSTITQQLAKLLFDRPSLRGRNPMVRAIMLTRIKLKEWLTAVKLEKSYTKEEIIAMYLNKFDFIYGANGIQAAARTYFGKDQSDLNASECATLIGMLKNPVLYNPKKFPQKSKNRRNTVLYLMRRADIITREDQERMASQEIDISGFNREAPDEGPAPYFRAELAKWAKNLFERPELRKPDGSKYNIYEDGLRFYTTIDLLYQKYAEGAAFQHMIDVQKRYNTVWKNKDPWTFEADKRQKDIRLKSLRNMIRETEQYQILWEQYFSKITGLISEDLGPTTLADYSIMRMLRQEKNNTYFSRALKSKELRKSQVESYNQIMSSSHWSNLKLVWKKFQEKVDADFNTKKDMIVYDFESGKDKIVTMSPLDSIKYHRRHLQIGSVALDPKTGFIKSWIGGTAFKFFKYDHVNSRRQVGSTFKPFVYSTAIAIGGISPCTEFQDIPYSIPAGDPNFGLPQAWSPGNARESFPANI